MKRAGVTLLLLLMSFSLLAAQEEGDEGEWDYYDDLYTLGDQTFTISIGTIFPTLFFGNGKKMDNKFRPPIGGVGSLSYNYFINKHIFLGIEAGGMFIPTLGGNMFFAIPIGLKGGYQFNYWKLEFPVSLTLGMAFQKYLDLGHFSLYMKGGGSAFYRFNNVWSFGANTNLYWFPQWTGNKSENAHGYMIDLTISARYHF